VNTNTPASGTAVFAKGPSVRASIVIALIGAIIAAGATMAVLRREYSTGIEALLAAVALGGFGLAAYGLIQAVLGVVDTAGERRRQEREVTERRKGDRARPPRT
jgi:hypothetical protein